MGDQQNSQLSTLAISMYQISPDVPPHGGMFGCSDQHVKIVWEEEQSTFASTDCMSVYWFQICSGYLNSLKGDKAGFCQYKTILSVSLLSSPPSFTVTVLVSLCVQAFLFMVQGSYLPKMIPLWRHEARQREKKKNLIKKGIICCQMAARPQPSLDTEKIQMAKKTHQ